MSGREIAAWRAKLEALAATRLESATVEAELKSALAALDTQVMAIEAQLSARGASDVSDRLVRVEQLRERARGLAAVLVERRRSLERDKGQLLDAGVVANLEADAARFRSELDEVVVSLAEIEPASEALIADEEAFRLERSRMIEAVGSDQSGAQAASAAAEVRGELRSVRSSLERSAGDLRRFRERFDSLAAKRDSSVGARGCGSGPSVTKPERSRSHSSPRSKWPKPHWPRRSRPTRPVSRCATTPPRRPRGARRGSRRSSSRSTRPGLAPAPSDSPASTACSARCST